MGVVPSITISSLASWARAIAGLESDGALSTRVVLVPSEAHAHALRLELVQAAPRALAGTRFLTPAAAARAVLDASDVDYQLGEEERRALRIRALLRSGLELATYPRPQMNAVGWEDAFASTIDQLEAAGLHPHDLDELGDPRTADLATLWRALDAAAGRSWSLSKIMDKAREILEREEAGWPFGGPALASVDVAIDAVHARLLRTIPRLTLAVHAGRPLRIAAIERMSALLGSAAAEALARPAPSPGGSRELDILAEHVFDAPERLASPTRRRSKGPDGSVSLEEYASVSEELDAAVRWVADEVYTHGTSLRDIAILLPTPDPLGAILADRLAGLPWDGDSPAVYLAAGRAATSTAAGARLLAVLRALAGNLAVDAMLELLPRLRLAGSDGHLSPKQAREVVHVLATVGGSEARPLDALRWRARLGSLDNELGTVVASIDALVGLAERALGGADLEQLWRAMMSFVDAHLIASREVHALVKELDADLRALLADPSTSEVTGHDALRVIAQRLARLRIRVGRYGDPAIYIGTVMEAAGLTFSAVRVLGLSEAAFPRTLREDPVLPSQLRRRLPRASIITDEDYSTAQLHALERVIRATRERLVVSTPRTDFDHSERGPAGVFIEIAAALGRPDALTGAPSSTIPTTDELERDGFQPARAAREQAVARAPLTEGCWLDVVARGASAIPSAWCEREVTSLPELVARAAALDGILGDEPLRVRIPGTEGAFPLSAAALRTLLACPHRFLLERVLGFWPRRELPVSHRIDAASYGTLVHRIVERLANGHGSDIGARARDREHWLGIADAIARAAFDAFVQRYPLTGEGNVAAELQRLREDIASFVNYDWESGPYSFVAAEREFGVGEPVAILTAAGPIYVTGRIDRIDIHDGATRLRDLKTGRARPRERDAVDPEVELDLQLGLYAIVVEQLATEWGIPSLVWPAYVYLDPSSPHRERSFRDDPDVLRRATQAWLDLAASLIRERAFVQTPNAGDCRYCPFSPVCGDVAEISKQRLAGATGALASYRELKS